MTLKVVKGHGLICSVLSMTLKESKGMIHMFSSLNDSKGSLGAHGFICSVLSMTSKVSMGIFLCLHKKSWENSPLKFLQWLPRFKCKHSHVLHCFLLDQHNLMNNQGLNSCHLFHSLGTGYQSKDFHVGNSPICFKALNLRFSFIFVLLLSPYVNQLPLTSS